MRKKFIFNEIMSALVLLLLASCSSSGWKLEGNLKGLQGGHLRLVWVDASGSVSEQRVVAEGDRFKAAGECAGMTLIAVYTGETRLLTLLAAEPGDKLELKGEVSRPYSLEVSGNEACEQWLKWRAAHTALLQNDDRSKLNAEIEKYVADHPADVASTLLALVDYYPADARATMALLDKINRAARPDELVATVAAYKSVNTSPSTNIIKNLEVWNMSDEQEVIKTNDNGYTLILFWNTAWLTGREPMVNGINALRESNRRLRVVSIYMEADTQAWRPTARLESMKQWHHVWAPTGMATPSFKSLHIESLPAIFVTDSTGRVLHRGSTLPKTIP